MDLGSNLIDDESLFCLPLLVRRQYPGPGKWLMITDCLLLKRLKPNAFEYTRVGLLSIALDLKDMLPQEIRWIAKVANSEPCSENSFIEMTIY